MSDGRRELPRGAPRLRLAHSPTIVHPVARRLVDELGAQVVGWIDRDGVVTTVAGQQFGTNPHPELTRLATRRAA